PYVRIVADAREHEVGVLRCFGRGTREAAAVFRRPALCLLRRAVVDRYVVPGLAEPAGHRIAHHAEPEKRHVRCHRRLQLRLVSSRAAAARSANSAYGPRPPAASADDNAQKYAISRTSRTTLRSSSRENGTRVGS